MTCVFMHLASRSHHDCISIVSHTVPISIDFFNHRISFLVYINRARAYLVCCNKRIVDSLTHDVLRSTILVFVLSCPTKKRNLIPHTTEYSVLLFAWIPFQRPLPTYLLELLIALLERSHITMQIKYWGSYGISMHIH